MKPNSSADSAIQINLELLKTLPLPEYSDDANKADYGKLLLVAGSRRLPGAAILAARAALRGGCGTVRVAAPESVASAIGIAVPELMVLPMPETADGTIALGAQKLLEGQVAACDAAVIGPGLDESEETQQLLKLLAHDLALPCVLDAAAIVALSGEKMKFAAPRVWTPHAQEMSVLSGRDVKEIQAAREAAATECARDWKSPVVLKGRETLIADAKGTLYKNEAGTRGMGTAGSGDVLAGLIGSLLAQIATQTATQKVESVRAAIWGVHLHALAGEAAEKEFGDDSLTASDLIARLPGVLRYARKHTAKKAEGERTGLRRE
jgi:hydroxyethylthiazole kinase-like uncharacterized protein yjeF